MTGVALRDPAHVAVVEGVKPEHLLLTAPSAH